MKNPFRRIFEIVTGPERPAPLALPPPPPSAEVRAAELAAGEASRLEQDARAALEHAQTARRSAQEALEAAEDAAAASPGARAVLDGLQEAQRNASLAAGVERSAERRLESARTARARADARVAGARADLERLAATSRIRTAATGADTARAAYASAAPAQKIAALASTIEEAMAAAVEGLAAGRVEVIAALAAAEEADARAMAAEPDRAEQIAAEARTRRADALEVLRGLGSSERWFNESAEPAVALYVLAAELQTMAGRLLDSTNAEAHAAGLAVKELGGAGEWLPMGPKHSAGALCLARHLTLSADAQAEQAARGHRIDRIVANAAGGQIDAARTWGPDLGSSSYHPAYHLPHVEVARYVLRHPTGRPGAEMEADGHARAIEKGVIPALEFEAHRTGAADPRLAEHRERQRREEEARQARMAQNLPNYSPAAPALGGIPARGVGQA